MRGTSETGISEIPVGTVLDNGWVVASLSRHIVPGTKLWGVTAFCPRCSQPQRVSQKALPKQCAVCISETGGKGQKKPKVTRGPDGWRSLVSEAAEAFGSDFRYGVEMAEWHNMIQNGHALQAERNRVE